MLITRLPPFRPVVGSSLRLYPLTLSRRLLLVCSCIALHCVGATPRAQSRACVPARRRVCLTSGSLIMSELLIPGESERGEREAGCGAPWWIVGWTCCLLRRRRWFGPGSFKSHRGGKTHDCNDPTLHCGVPCVPHFADSNDGCCAQNVCEGFQRAKRAHCTMNARNLDGISGHFLDFFFLKAQCSKPIEVVAAAMNAVSFN